MTLYLADLVKQLDTLNLDEVNAILIILRGSSFVYVIGNGGSAANASHLSLHLADAGLRAMDLTAEAPYLTAQANDHGYAKALLNRLRGLGRSTDTLVAISGSGDSPNILAALAEAKRLRMDRVGLLGFGGGAAKELCSVSLVVQSRNYGIIEDCHSACIHALASLLAAPPAHARNPSDPAS